MIWYKTIHENRVMINPPEDDLQELKKKMKHLLERVVKEKIIRIKPEIYKK